MMLHYFPFRYSNVVAGFALTRYAGDNSRPIGLNLKAGPRLACPKFCDVCQKSPRYIFLCEILHRLASILS